jgi:hypothetical protein
MASAMDVMDPFGHRAVERRRLTARPATLTGLTVGLLDNSKPNARVLLERVGTALVERRGAAGIRWWTKPGSSAGATAAVLEEMAAKCGVALTASAD